MKNPFEKTIKKILLHKLLNSLREDLSFYANHTELFAIWTLLFGIIAGLFIFSVNSNIFIILLSLITGVAIVFTIAFFSIHYLYAINYDYEKKLLIKIHNTLNRSFELRHLFYFIKIPRISILNNFVRNIKFAH